MGTPRSILSSYSEVCNSFVENVRFNGPGLKRVTSEFKKGGQWRGVQAKATEIKGTFEGGKSRFLLGRCHQEKPM